MVIAKRLFHFFVVDIFSSLIDWLLLGARLLLRIEISLLVVSKLLRGSTRTEKQRSYLINDIQNEADNKKKLKHGFLFDI